MPDRFELPTTAAARRAYFKLRVGSLASALRVVTSTYKQLAGRTANPHLVSDLESWRAVAEDWQPRNEITEVDWQWLTSIR